MGSQKKDPLVPAVVEKVRVGIKNLAKIQIHPFPAVLDYKTPSHSQCQWKNAADIHGQSHRSKTRQKQETCICLGPRL